MMDESIANDAGPQAAFAWVVGYDRMGGWPGLWVDIPAGHVGVPIRNGQVSDQVLPAGQPKVVGWRDILLGRVTAIEAAVMNARPVMATLLSSRLRPTDRDLVDLWAQVTFRVSDPVRFTGEYLQRVRQATPMQVLSDLAAPLRPRLSDELANFPETAPADSPAADTLAQTLRDLLGCAAAAWGLEVQEVHHLSVRPSMDQVAYLQKLQQFERELAALEVKRRIDDVEQVAQWVRLLTQMEQDFELPSGVALGALEDMPGGRPVKDIILSRLQARRRELEEQVRSQPKPRLEEAVEQRGASAALAEPLPPGDLWWFKLASILRWGAYLLYTGVVILALINPGHRSHQEWVSVVYLLSGLPIALIMLASALHLDRKIAEVQARRARPNRLLALGRGSLEQVDRAVREQAASELSHIEDILVELRHTLYSRGDEDAALRLKTDALRRVKQLREKAAQPDEGKPAYLNYDHLPWEQLSPMLDRDEEFLALTQEVHTAVSALRQALPKDGQELAQRLNDIERDLKKLEDAFAARSRV